MVKVSLKIPISASWCRSSQ